jgi:glutathione S-transferase
MTLTVHHLGQSQSERIVWLCEELELDYMLKRYDRRADNRLAPDEYKALHPMGICARYGNGRLVPAVDDPDFADHLFWLHWSNGTFMTTGMMELVLGLAAPGVDIPFVRERSERGWAMVEARLGDAPYFGGAQLTTADIMMGYALTTGRRMRGTRIDGFPNLQAYLQRIGERPAYQRAMAKAEPGTPPNLT